MLWHPDPPQGFTTEQGQIIIGRPVIPLFGSPQGFGGAVAPPAEDQLLAIYPPLADNTFQFYKFYQIKKNNVPTPQINMPLVIIDTLGAGILQQASGFDIRAFDSLNTPIPYEVQSVNVATGEIIVWVNPNSTPLNWFNELWLKRIPLTINPGQVPSVQNDFPILINGIFPDLIGHSSNELRFAGIDTVQLEYHIEEFDTLTGELTGWVKKPTISDGDIVYIYYDNVLAVDEQNPNAVYDGNYKAVYNLNETTNTQKDSTVNANDGNIAVVNNVDGKIDGALELDGIVDRVIIPNSTSFNFTNALTLSIWFKPNILLTGVDAGLLSKWDNAFESWFVELGRTGDDARVELAGTTPADWNVALPTFLAGVDYLFDLTYDGITKKIYINGDLAASIPTTGNIDITSLPVNIGQAMATGGIFHFFPGVVDETRLSNIARSADYIKTRHNNENDNDVFFTVGSSEPLVHVIKDLDTIQLTFGKPSATDGSTPNAVFDSRYDLVYHMNITGGSVLDSTANNNTGTLINGPINTVGKIGQAVLFNGINQSIDPLFNITNTGKWSIVLWSIQLSRTGDDFIIDFQSGRTIIGVRGTNNFEVFDGVPAWNDTGVNASDKFHQVVVTRNGLIMKVYVDKVLTNTIVGQDLGGLIGIGADFNQAPNHYNGITDEIEILDDELLQDEITTLFNNQNDNDAFWFKTPTLENNQDNFLVDDMDRNIVAVQT